MGTTRTTLAAAALTAGLLATTTVMADAVDPGIVDPEGRPQVAGTIFLSTQQGTPLVRDLALADGTVWAVGGRVTGSDADALVARITAAGESDDVVGGSGGDIADAVAAGSWGAVVAARLAGQTGSDPSVAVRRYDAAGELTWSATVPGAGIGASTDVAVSGDTVYVTAADTVATFDLDDGTAGTSTTLAGTARSVAALDGDVFVAGTATSAVPGGGGGKGGQDIVLRRLDGDTLTTTWTRQLGSAFNDHDPAVATGDGVVYLTSTYSHDSLDRADIWSLTPAGETNWRNRATGEQHTVAHNVTATDAGPVIVGSADIGEGYVYSWSRSGRRRWSQNEAAHQYGGAVYGVVALPHGLLIGGDASKSSALGNSAAGGFVAALISHRPQATIRAGGADYDPWAVFGVHPGRSKTASLRLTNAGDVAESFVLAARCRHPKGVRYQVLDRGKDIASRICGGSTTVRLRPGQVRTLTVVATAGRGARPGSSATAVFHLRTPSYQPADSQATLKVNVLKRPKRS